MLNKIRCKIGFENCVVFFYSPNILQESIVDTRFNLLAKDFKDQIDDLKGKVIKREDIKSIGIIDEHEQHKIKKRQTNESKQKRRMENINSPCIFYYPDHPDAGREKENYSQNIINKEPNNASKLTRPICETSSSFCTYLYPDHLDAGRKKGNYTPIVRNEVLLVENTITTEKTLPTGSKDTIRNTITERPEVDRTTPAVNTAILKDPTKFKKMPTSCKDLQFFGHKTNGIYLVKTSRPNEGVKVEAVFCDFQSQTAVSDIGII